MFYEIKGGMNSEDDDESEISVRKRLKREEEREVKVGTDAKRKYEG